MALPYLFCGVGSRLLSRTRPALRGGMLTSSLVEGSFDPVNCVGFSWGGGGGKSIQKSLKVQPLNLFVHCSGTAKHWSSNRQGRHFLVCESRA